MSAGADTELQRLRLARTIAAVVTIAALVLLVFMALAARAGSAGFALIEPAGTSAASAPALPTVSPPPDDEVAAPTAATPVVAPSPASRADVPTPEAAGPTEVLPSETSAPEDGDDGDDGDDPEPVPATTCPAGLPAPERSGGVHSLIGFVPFFGPFTAEGFATEPAWGPLVEVMGPGVAAFAEFAEGGAPVSDALVGPVQDLEYAGYDVIAPVYDPYRQDFLDAETQLATLVAPVTSDVADSEGAACAVAAQGLLFDNF